MPRALAFINPRMTTRNVGDIFIEDSAKRILNYDVEHSIDIDPRRPIPSAEIDRINATSAAVILGTNLWYRDIEKPGRWMFRIEDLRRIRVPVIPFGLGTSRQFDEDNGFSPRTLEQLHWIHASCAMTSARDPRTRDALAEAGLKNVAMTGCPTLFRALLPEWKLRAGKDSHLVTVTTRHGQKQNARTLLARLREKGFEHVIAAQKSKDRSARLPIPFRPPHPRTLFQFEMTPYIELVERSIGAIGWRLHGNMLHLAHGNPAIFFANNSRAASFCDAFGLPCVASPDRERIPAERIIEHTDRLFDAATFDRFPARYTAVRSEMARFLDENHLEHRL